MNASVHPISSKKSVLPELDQRFQNLERLIAQLKQSIQSDQAVLLQGRAARAAAVVDLLNSHGAVTVADVKRELGVTMKMSGWKSRMSCTCFSVCPPDMGITVHPRRSAP